jgi:endonuclease YncB( thermonuclease family)
MAAAILAAFIWLPPYAPAPAPDPAFTTSFYIASGGALKDIFKDCIVPDEATPEGFTRVQAKITVISGDSFTIDGSAEPFRLAYIAAPKLEEYKGVDSLENLQHLLHNLYLLDSFPGANPMEVFPFIKEDAGGNIAIAQRLIIADGLARVDRARCYDFLGCQAFRHFQDEAESAGIGMWDSAQFDEKTAIK